MKKTLAVVLALGVFGIGGMMNGKSCQANLLVNGDFTDGLSGWRHNDYVNAYYPGTEAAFGDLGPNPQTGVIGQVFDTIPNAIYNLSFDYLGFVARTNGLSGIPVGIGVSVAGFSVVERDNLGRSYPMSQPNHYSYEFTATSSSTGLTFMVSTGAYCYAVLDNVSVTAVNAVPVPATMLLFGPGVAGLIGARVRRKNR